MVRETFSRCAPRASAARIGRCSPGSLRPISSTRTGGRRCCVGGSSNRSSSSSMAGPETTRATGRPHGPADLNPDGRLENKDQKRVGPSPPPPPASCSSPGSMGFENPLCRRRSRRRNAPRAGRGQVSAEAAVPRATGQGRIRASSGTEPQLERRWLSCRSVAVPPTGAHSTPRPSPRTPASSPLELRLDSPEPARQDDSQYEVGSDHRADHGHEDGLPVACHRCSSGAPSPTSFAARSLPPGSGGCPFRSRRGGLAYRRSSARARSSRSQSSRRGAKPIASTPTSRRRGAGLPLA